PASWTAAAAGITAGAVRQVSTSGSPRLHLADHRGGNAWIGSARTADGTHLASPASLRPGTREPKLRFKGLHGAGAGPTPGGRSNGAAAPRYSGSKSAPKMNFSGGRPSGGAAPRYSGSKSAPKMNFSSAGRRDGLADRGSGPTSRTGAAP